MDLSYDGAGGVSDPDNGPDMSNERGDAAEPLGKIRIEIDRAGSDNRNDRRPEQADTGPQRDTRRGGLLLIDRLGDGLAERVELNGAHGNRWDSDRKGLRRSRMATLKVG
jgi:hypothetical protein